jgi:hypothetical protein
LALGLDSFGNLSCQGEQGALHSMKIWLRTLLRPHDQIEAARKLLLREAKCLADEPLPAIADDGAADLARDT